MPVELQRYLHSLHQVQFALSPDTANHTRSGKANTVLKKTRWMHTQPRISSKEDIIFEMLLLEQKTTPERPCLFLQPEIGWEQRFQLVQMLLQSHSNLQLCHDTLFLAVNIMDRYSTKISIRWKGVELLCGVTLLIASKYMDQRNRIPSIHQKGWLLYKATQQQVFDMERNILDALEHLVGSPTPYGFFHLELRHHERTKEVEDMALYVCKLTLFYGEFVSVPCSITAKAAVAITRLALKLPPQPVLEPHINKVYPVLVRIFKKLSQVPEILFAEYSRPENSSVALTLDRCLLQYMTS